jgi:hypothetical protein
VQEQVPVDLVSSKDLFFRDGALLGPHRVEGKNGLAQGSLVSALMPYRKSLTCDLTASFFKIKFYFYFHFHILVVLVYIVIFTKCLQYILVRFISSIFLLYSPFFLLRIVSTGLIFPLLYMRT